MTDTFQNLMMRIAYVVLTCMMSFVCALHARAAQIRMETRLDADYSGDSPVLDVRSFNKGPSAVYDLSVTVECAGRISETLVRPELGVNDENRSVFSLKPEKSEKGLFAAVVRVNYRDRDGIPVSNSHVHPVSFGVSPLSDVQVAGQSFSFCVSGSLDFHIRNIGGEKRNAIVRLIYPPSVSVKEDSKGIQIKPGSEKTVSFSVLNRYANTGDGFQVFCLVEYETSGGHVTSIGQADVVITEKDNISSYLRYVLWTMQVMGLGAGLWVILMKRKGGHDEKHSSDHAG